MFIRGLVGRLRGLFGLGEYPFFLVLLLAVSPLRRLTFLQAPKKVSKKR
jgi:hypothetical protein